MSLKAMQQNFKTAALTGECKDFLKAQLPYESQESKDRFWVYQNNIIENLVSTLGSTYSACEKLVGEDFFNQCAREFVKNNVPQEASLYKYGQGFIAHFDNLGRQHNYAYWGDVAAFEWAESECFFERDVKALGPQDLSTLHEETFAALTISLSPAMRLLKTDFNIQEIINATKDDAPEELNIISESQHYLFYRNEQKVFVDPLNNIVFGALQSLKTPISLAGLAEKFSRQGCEEHFGPFIQMLFEKELIVTP